MTQWTAWGLLQWAAVYVVARSAIGYPIRALICRLGAFPCIGIYCPACVGFWSGLGVGAVLQPFGHGGLPLLLSGAAGLVLSDVLGNYVLTHGSTLFAFEQPQLAGPHHDTTPTSEGNDDE